MRIYTVSEAARELSSRLGWEVLPRQISDLFYRRKLSDKRCEIVGRVRLIRENYLPDVERELRQLADKRPTAEVAS